jgi:hypothetical protein
MVVAPVLERRRGRTAFARPWSLESLQVATGGVVRWAARADR